MGQKTNYYLKPGAISKGCVLKNLRIYFSCVDGNFVVKMEAIVCGIPQRDTGCQFSQQKILKQKVIKLSSF
jgi:hypothetical protein